MQILLSPKWKGQVVFWHSLLWNVPELLDADDGTAPPLSCFYFCFRQLFVHPLAIAPNPDVYILDLYHNIKLNAKAKPISHNADHNVECRNRWQWLKYSLGLRWRHLRDVLDDRSKSPSLTLTSKLFFFFFFIFWIKVGLFTTLPTKKKHIIIHQNLWIDLFTFFAGSFNSTLINTVMNVPE